MKTTKTKIKIEVTPRDIKKGECNDPYNCAIALALKRSLRKEHISFRNVFVESGHATVHPRRPAGDNLWFPLPKRARNFIFEFDDLGDFGDRSELKPFSFEVRV